MPLLVQLVWTWLLQIMAGARCKINKTKFLLGIVFGKKWRTEKLFREADEAELPQEPRQIVELYKRSSSRSSSVR